MTEHFTVRLFFLLFVMVLWLVWRVLTLLTKTNIQVRIMFSRALLRSPHLFGSSFCIDRYSLLRRLFLCCFSSRVASTIHARVTIFFKSRRLSYIAYILTCSHANACFLFPSSAAVAASYIRYNILCRLWLESGTIPATEHTKQGGDLALP